MQERNQKNWQGIDVSHWQGAIDWQQVQKAGIQFVFIKVSEGSKYVDPLWKANVQGARNTGIKIGLYHFGRFDSEMAATTEALHFVQTIHGIQSDLPHVLDLEVTNSLDKVALSQAAKIFMEKIHAETGHSVMLYTNTNMAQNHLTDLLKDYPLWIAHYGVEWPVKNGIWDAWQAFQYSSQGKVSGIKGFVDLDEMVPEPLPISKSRKPVKTYQIRPGDTFWELEEKNHWRHGTLQKLNPGLEPTRLRIGEKIITP